MIEKIFKAGILLILIIFLFLFYQFSNNGRYTLHQTGSPWVYSVIDTRNGNVSTTTLSDVLPRVITVYSNSPEAKVKYLVYIGGKDVVLPRKEEAIPAAPNPKLR